jgi:hypothetical protein
VAETNFIVVNGTFYCKKCSEEVLSMRFWPLSGDTTWMCSNKHLSKVSLMPQKKKKADYE